MLIKGCDLHTRFQQIALLDTTTGEIVTRRLEHEKGEAQKFYAGLPERARVGIEARGYHAVVRAAAGGSAGRARRSTIPSCEFRVSQFPPPILPRFQSFGDSQCLAARLRHFFFRKLSECLMTDIGAPCTRQLPRTG